MKDEKTSRELAEVAEAAAEGLAAMMQNGGRRGPDSGPADGPDHDPRGPAWWRDRVWGKDAGDKGRDEDRPGGGGRKDATTDPDAGKSEDEPRWKRELRARLEWARREIARERSGKGVGAETSAPEVAGGHHREDRGRERGGRER